MRALCAPVKCLAIVLALCLAGMTFGSLSVSTSLVWADEVTDAQAAVQDAQAVLEQAEFQMEKISEEYDAISAEIGSLQNDIDELAAQVLEVQDEVIAGREQLGQTIQYEYRSGSTFSLLISLIFDSENLTDLLKNIDYLNLIMQRQADDVADQKARKQQLEQLADELNEQKDTQVAYLEELENKRADAQRIVDEASAKLASAQAAEEQARIAALQAQAEKIAREKEQAAAAAATAVTATAATTTDTTTVTASESTSDAGNTNASTYSTSGTSGNGGSDNATSYSESYAASSSDNATSSDTSSSSGWMTGLASAYGGSTDPSVPNPSSTASGAICDDNSMGVAIPTSFPNYRSYFGRTVEISYGGMTVYATVNDCGYMGGGSRVLDLQPGVWKAFGFTSCNAWGVRTVSYRFL